MSPTFDNVVGVDFDTFKIRSSCGFQYVGIFHDRALGSNLRFRKPEKFSEGEDIHVWPKLGSGFSRYHVTVNYRGVISRKKYLPCATSEVTKSPIG